MDQAIPGGIRRVAIVTAGFGYGGGVPVVASWLRDQLRAIGGYTVDMHDLATSSHDGSSRRLLAPRSWLRRSLRSRPEGDDSVAHWGANAVEVEAMRYRPRYELKKTLQTYDIIQVVAGSPAWAAAVIGAGVPVVLQCATTVARERQQLLAEEAGIWWMWRRGMTALTTRVESRALREVDAVLVENSEMLEHVRSLGQRHVIVAPPGVDMNRWSPPEGGWRREGYLLTVCRLDDPRKGLRRTIRAYGLLVRADGSIPALLIAGQGHLPAHALALVDELGLSTRVTVRSDVAASDLVEIYRGASVFLQSSYEEGLGLAVLEAMACGLPVVCTETAGTRETVVDGATGWLVKQDNDSRVPQLIADRVLDVLRCDGATMGMRARERCERTFANDITFRRFTEAYERLQGPRGA